MIRSEFEIIKPIIQDLYENCDANETDENDVYSLIRLEIELKKCVGVVRSEFLKLNDDGSDIDDSETNSESDSDVIEPPRPKRSNELLPMTLKFVAQSTALEDVGVQIWQASALATEFVFTESLFDLCEPTNVVEFGCGVGLLGCALLANKHITAMLTDYNSTALELIQHNMTVNSTNFDRAMPHIVQLDWLKISQANEKELCELLTESQREFIKKAKFVFAADW